MANNDPKNPKRKGPKSSAAGTAEKGGGLGFYLLLGLIAAAGVAWLVLARTSPGVPEARPISVADMEAEASGAAGETMGPADAPVTIIEFEDYRCPSCRQFNSLTGRLMRQNYATGDDAILRWVSYDYPIFGQASWAPMVAARCAGAQDRFWQMHDLLYARTEAWYGETNPNAAFIELAEDVGLDGDRFRQCLEERPHLAEIAASRKYGEALGVSSTPTLYLNGRPLDPNRYHGYQALEQLVRETAAARRDAEAAENAGNAEGGEGSAAAAENDAGGG